MGNRSSDVPSVSGDPVIDGILANPKRGAVSVRHRDWWLYVAIAISYVSSLMISLFVVDLYAENRAQNCAYQNYSRETTRTVLVDILHQLENPTNSKRIENLILYTEGRLAPVACSVSPSPSE